MIAGRKSIAEFLLGDAEPEVDCFLYGTHSPNRKHRLSYLNSDAPQERAGICLNV